MFRQLPFQNASQSHDKKTLTISPGMDLDTFLICMGIAVGGFIILCLVMRYCCLADVVHSGDRWYLRGRGRVLFNRASHEQTDDLSTPIVSGDEASPEAEQDVAVVDPRPSADAEPHFYANRVL